MFFHFSTAGELPSKGLPLVCLNGGIMADSGNEAPAYIYSCQDRYPVYAALDGLRCLLLIRDEPHLRLYQARLGDVRRHLNTIARATGITLIDNLPEPLYLPCELTPGQVSVRRTEHLLRQIRDPEVINSHLLGGVYLNQLSPTISTLLGQFYGILRDEGYNVQVRMEEYDRMAREALRWHNKEHYVDLLRRCKDSTSLPTHVPSATFSSRLLREMTWGALMRLFRQQTGDESTGRFILKSTLEAAGEVCVTLDEESFSSNMRKLAEGIAGKATQMSRTQHEVPLLLQPFIERSGRCGDLPSSIGLTYKIFDSERVERVAVVGHLYEDVELKTFIGSYLCDSLTEHFLESVGEDKIRSLLRLFAARGYRGPINLDAIRNTQGEYIFIYDCNPRLGGAFPGLVLKGALERAGLRADRLVNPGYRGRIVFRDLRAKLEELKEMDLLYTRDRQAGVTMVPSLVRPDSFDLILINMKTDAMRDFVHSDPIASLSERDQCDLQGVYW